MDQEALVDRILEDGARLDVEISRRGFRLGAPIAAFDLGIGQWALLFGFPSQVSRRQVYESAQAAIADLGLALNLDRIVLVKDADPGLRELRDTATASRELAWDSQSSVVEVAGREFSNARVVSVRPSQYEELVWSALERSIPMGLDLRRGDDAVVHAQRELNDASRRHRGVRVDFVVVAGDRVVLIEAKASRRPLHTERVLSALGQLSYFQHEAGSSQVTSLILVSMSGFTMAARNEFDDFEGLVLVEWSPGQDEKILVNALMKALSA